MMQVPYLSSREIDRYDIEPDTFQSTSVTTKSTGGRHRPRMRLNTKEKL